MPVLIEGVCILVRLQSVMNRYRGGADALLRSTVFDSACSDEHLVRLGFLTTDGAFACAENLGHHGIRPESNDVAVVDQQDGFLTPCDWAELGNVGWDGDRRHIVVGCRLVGDSSLRMSVPEDWHFNGSLSQQYPATGPRG